VNQVHPANRRSQIVGRGAGIGAMTLPPQPRQSSAKGMKQRFA
jgi:hypothetical protein